MATPSEVLDLKSYFTFPQEMESNPFEIRNSAGEPLLVVRKDGSIKLKDREVESDEEVRRAVVIMLKALSGLKVE